MLSHLKPLPNAPNSEEAPPTSILVMFTFVYITPLYQNHPLHSPPSLPAPTASEIPYPAPINIIIYISPVTPAAIEHVT